jgi:TRAP-type mannitol/chloroaromatic compound transport system permease small subunit|tara:strand:- start:74 stop:745 length:672 start_codon:yes stop_codon:yes gene_type:complete
MGPFLTIIVVGISAGLFAGVAAFFLKGSAIIIKDSKSLKEKNDSIERDYSKAQMPRIINLYVNLIDFLCIKIGRLTMYMVFVMMFILVLSFVTRNIINIPLMWIIEMAQFIITGYYLLGGGYSMIMGDHVRMDLVYSKLSDRNKAKMDVFTSFFLVFYLVTLLYGSISSLIYTIETKQRLFTAWAPYVWPIKTIMLIGISLMLLQCISMFFKDIAKVMDREIK